MKKEKLVITIERDVETIDVVTSEEIERLKQEFQKMFPWAMVDIAYSIVGIENILL